MHVQTDAMTEPAAAIRELDAEAFGFFVVVTVANVVALVVVHVLHVVVVVVELLVFVVLGFARAPIRFALYGRGMLAVKVSTERFTGEGGVVPVTDVVVVVVDVLVVVVVEVVRVIVSTASVLVSVFVKVLINVAVLVIVASFVTMLHNWSVSYLLFYIGDLSE